MKGYIEKDSQSRKPASRDLKEIAGSFLSAASVFSKKLQKWRKKQKMKKSETGSTSGTSGLATMPVDKQYSEIQDYTYGRRSCDIDPRFSLDIGRMSFDAPRYSLDEPRASWDGYLIGKTFPRLPPMGSVLEDVLPVPVKRTDTHIAVEEPLNSVNGDYIIPGGTAQTRDYYSETFQRRRRSFDRSSSGRRKSVGLENDDMNSVCNAKVSPGNVDIFHGATLIGTDRDVRDFKSNSLRHDRTESFESTFRDSSSISCNVDQKGLKKSSRWSKAKNIWGLLHKKSINNNNKDDEEERDRSNNRGNVVERSFSQSWQDRRKNSNGESKPGLNQVFRSNSSISSRTSMNPRNAFGGGTKNVADINGFGKKKTEEVVFERTRSARYSTSDIVDNGLLQLYLTPLRNKSNSSGNSRPGNPQSIARRVLRLY